MGQMTGLDPTNDTILSIACYLTTAQLDLIHPKPFTATIYHDPANSPSLANMSAWCQETHGRSGLSEAVKNPPLPVSGDSEPTSQDIASEKTKKTSSTLTAHQAATALHVYITTHIPTSRIALLAGNSIHADRSFLLKEPWSLVLSHLHPYRLLDVSALKEAARRWLCDEDLLRNTPAKRGLHEAEADVWESIEEARYYRKVIFRK